MVSILELKIYLKLTQELLEVALINKNSQRTLELINVRSILKDTLIETYERELEKVA